ncbi:MAG: D-glycero-beta-D-manno-heptose-7-phosphate kinase [Nitrospirae bacterium]|nr:D-glycero-beta-D-manno-heptose-7-phosphate kinase [Nitrospirota bacterium]
MNRLSGYINKFNNATVLVVGDIIADHYVWGKVERISPEAPVPIVDVQSESYLLGGAGNVASNILSLGGKVRICGVIGSDDMGRWISNRLKSDGVCTDGIIVEEGRPSSKKTRVIAHSQHVVRFDHESRGEISLHSQDLIFDYIRTHINDIKVVIISDYAKGVITSRLVKNILQLAAENNLCVIVDPKLKHFDFYTGATVITPNTSEASIASGLSISDDETLLKAGNILLNQSNAEAILITRSEHGMSLFQRGHDATHIPAFAREVYDVTGAGDTVVSTLALSVAAGASLTDAALLANYAGGIVVGIVGTATVHQEQLIAALTENPP